MFLIMSHVSLQLVLFLNIHCLHLKANVSFTHFKSLLSFCVFVFFSRVSSAFLTVTVSWCNVFQKVTEDVGNV